MLGLRRALVVVLVILFVWPAECRADLQQLGDAWADVVTFGAWGQSRDTHELEIAALKKRHEEEIKRLQNQSEAVRLTEAIQHDRLRALDAQFTGQQLLRVLSLIDVLFAQIKDEIANRYKTNKNVEHFAEWFDSFVNGTNDHTEALVELIRVSAKDPNSDNIQAVLKAAKIEQVQRQKQVDEARAYLKNAIAASNFETLNKSLGTLFTIRTIIVQVIEQNRKVLHESVSDMAANDVARRILCDPNPVAVTCDTQNHCKYYNAAGPGPCNDVVFVNFFPVEFVKRIFDDLPSYRENAEFYVDFARIGTEGPITKSAYASPTDIFSSDLKAHPLLPPDFLLPKQCHDFKALRTRLMESIEYAELFAGTEGLTQTSKARIAWLRKSRGYLVFSLDGMAISVKTANGCEGVSAATKAQLDLLKDSVAAVETFGEALTLNQTAEADEKNLFKPVEKMANDL
ncbi:MAG: hypothetical protein WCA19_02555 [Candidatus Acidiferrales bacterium]